MKIAYLGPEGTYTEEAALKHNPEPERIAYHSIADVIRAVENDEVPKAVVPLENLIDGPVNVTLDTLYHCQDTNIIECVLLPIKHCIGTIDGTRDAKKIISKQEALNQCRSYLEKHYAGIETDSTGSTAHGIEMIAKQKLYDVAGIGSEFAMEKYGLKILDRDIGDETGNRTMFAVLSKEKTSPTGNDKTSIAIHPKEDRVGLLNDITGIFKAGHINMEMIYSRPDRKGAYIFYIGLKGHAEDENVRKALDFVELSLDPRHKYENTIKNLGSYPHIRL